MLKNKKMKRLFALLFLCSTAAAQTVNLTVVSDTNRVIRTNFTIGNAQVTGLSALLAAKLATNGNGAGLTNLTGGNVVGAVATASNITGILAISNGGTGSSSASNARTALGLGTAATNPSTAFQTASTNLTALASGDGSSLTNVATTDASQLTNFPSSVLLTNSSNSVFPSFLLRTNGDGGGLTNLTATNFLPPYTSQDGKVLAVATGGTNIEWTAISNTVTDASLLTNFPTLNQNTTGTASNVTGVVQITNGGTGTNSASGARVNLLPSYTGNSNKVLAINAGGTDVEWITQTGGGTSGVTSVDVSGGSTGLTTSGGPITNSGTITLGGTLAIAAGGTGATNAASAIEAFLPAYTNNANKVLALNTNATALVWTTNAGGGGGSGTVTSIDASGGSTGMNFTGGPVTTSGTLTLGGTLAIGNGGTGASDLTNARINLLPAYTNNAGKALVVNTNGTDIEWIAIATAPVSVANGGTGATNTTNALINLSIVNTNNGVRIGPVASVLSGVAIGNSARAVSTNGTDGANGVAIGGNAYSSTNGVTIGYNAGSVSGVAIGNGALTGAEAIAIGKNSAAEPGIAVGTSAGAYEVGAVALGDNARADNTNSIQIGTGTNSTENVAQIRNWGLVNSNAWAALANSTAIGREIMQAPTNGSANQVLTLNSNATDVEWTAAGSGIIDLSTTNATGILPVVKGGTGGTNGLQAQTNLAIITDSGTTVALGTTTSGTNKVVIGTSATAGARGISIGHDSESNGPDTIVIGNKALISASSGTNSIAIGAQAGIFAAVNAVQLGNGTNSNSTTIQFRTAGSVDTNSWNALANSSAGGRYAMTNTNTISGSKTFVAYDGTNYTTNTVTFSNGLITEWTQ